MSNLSNKLNEPIYDTIGYIYCFSNPSFKLNYYKIGRTKDHPSKRIKELYKTGVPDKFKLEFCRLVKNYEKVEKEIHETLKNYRVNNKREFFEVDINIIKTIFEDYDDEENQDYMEIVTYDFDNLTFNIPKLNLQQTLQQNAKQNIINATINWILTNNPDNVKYFDYYHMYEEFMSKYFNKKKLELNEFELKVKDTLHYDICKTVYGNRIWVKLIQ
jgi:hypothetical protein